MAMKNIEMFDKFVGCVFAELYDNFPVCVKIDAARFLKEIDESGERSELIFSETLFWLRDAGFLSFVSPQEKEISHFDGVVAYPVFSCVVLSVKGLEILKKIPKSITEKESIGESIVKAAKDGAKAELSALVGMALGTMIKTAF